jgi:hypothetical protein
VPWPGEPSETPTGTNLVRSHIETVLIPRFAATLNVPESNVAAALSHLIG